MAKYGKVCIYMNIWQSTYAYIFFFALMCKYVSIKQYVRCHVDEHKQSSIYGFIIPLMYLIIS